MKRKSKAIISALAAMTVAMSSCPGILPEAIPVASTALVAEAATKYYKVNVTGGILSNGKTSGSAKESQYITVTADAAQEGQKFSHWMKNGVIVSNDTTYSFRMPSSSVNLEAVFVDTSQYTNTGGTAAIESVTPNKSTKKISFTAALNVPANCTFVKGGLVATSDHSVGAGVSAYSAEYIKLSTKATAKTKNLKYTWTKSNVTADSIWYVCAYLVYKDANGKERTVYSECVKYSLKGDVSNENGAFYDEAEGIMTLKGHVSRSDVSKYKYESDLQEIYAEPGTVLPENCYDLFAFTCARKIDLSNADTSNVTNMSEMFYDAYNLTELNINNFNTSKVTDMSYMFGNTSKLETLDVSSFDTSKVQNMSHMFYYFSKVKDLDLSNFDTSKVTDMNWMFYYCSELENLNISGWNTSNVAQAQYMFGYAKKMTDIDVSVLDFSSLINAYGMFYECDTLTSVDMSTQNLSNLKNAGYIFAYSDNLKTAKFGNASTSNLENAGGLFCGCKNLESVDVSTLNTSNAIYLYNVFNNCEKLTDIDVRSFDTGNATNIESMFAGCKMLTSIDVTGFNTSKATDMSYMFSSCELLDSIDIRGFDTSNVTNMIFMFAECTNLESLDLSSFDTSNVTKMSYMFLNCSGLTNLDVSGFNTSNVTDMREMFFGCSGLISLDIGGFDTSKVKNMSSMFKGCTLLPYVDISSFNMSNVTDCTDMFTNSPLLLANCNSYYSQYLTKGYQTTIKTVFTPSENAKTVIVSVGDRSEEFNIEDIPDYYYSAEKKELTYSFVSNRTKSTDYFKIKVLDVDGRTLPFNNSNSKPYSYCTSERSLSDITRNIYRVTKVVGDTSTFTEYNTSKSHKLDRMLLGNITIPEGYKLAGWEVKCSSWGESSHIYSLAENTSFWTYPDTTGDTTFTAVLVEKEHTVPVTLPLNTPTSGHYEYDDYDLFAFTAEEAGTYVFTSDSPKYSFAQLYGDAEMQNFILSNNDGNGYGKFRVQIDLEKGQTVYLKPIGNNVMTDVFDYTVKVRKMSAEPVKMHMLALDGTATGHYEDCGEYDVFSFTAAEDGIYLFSGENTEGGIYGELYSDAELTDEISYDYNYSEPFTIRAELTAGQTVYLRPTGYNSDESCDYTVSVAKKVVVLSEPIALELDTETDGRYVDMDEYDRFSFTAPEDGLYIFKGRCSQGEVYAELYSDAAMTDWIAGADTHWTDWYVDFTIRVELEAGQTVYLKPIYSYDDSCNYTVTVKRRTLEPNELVLNVPVTGHYEDSDFYDVFSFTAEDEGDYIFVTDGGYTSMESYLYDAETDSELASDYYGNYTSTIEYHLEAGQKVYLKPNSYYYDSCDYTVTVMYASDYVLK